MCTHTCAWCTRAYLLRPQCMCGDQTYHMEIHSLFLLCAFQLELGASGLATVLSGPSVLSQLPNKQFCFILCSRILWSNFLFQSSDTFRDKVSSCCGMLSPACKHLMKLSRKIMFVAFTECKIKCEVKLSWVSPQTEHCSIQCFQVSLWSDSFSNISNTGEG